MSLNRILVLLPHSQFILTFSKEVLAKRLSLSALNTFWLENQHFIHTDDWWWFSAIEPIHHSHSWSTRGIANLIASASFAIFCIVFDIFHTHIHICLHHISCPRNAMWMGRFAQFSLVVLYISLQKFDVGSTKMSKCPLLYTACLVGCTLRVALFNPLSYLVIRLWHFHASLHCLSLYDGSLHGSNAWTERTFIYSADHWRNKQYRGK